jgi:hypothetical protein
MRHSVKFRKQIINNRSRKTIGGSSTVDSRSVKTALKKLNSLLERSSKFCTSGELSSSLPPAILAAKEAIEYANANPGNEFSIEYADIKSKIADYWTEKCSKRVNWRNEKNKKPNHSARDWYEPGSKVLWKVDINEKAKQKMNTILPGLMEEVSLIPVDDEMSEIGKEYRKGKRRFEKRARGSRSRSRSKSSSRSSSKST